MPQARGIEWLRRLEPAGPCRTASPELAVSRLRRELLHPFGLPLLHFLAREVFFARCDRSTVPMWVGDGSAAITPELIPHLPHGPAGRLRARRNGAVEQRVAILHVDPERSR